jgi:hypothetical protein
LDGPAKADLCHDPAGAPLFHFLLFDRIRISEVLKALVPKLPSPPYSGERGFRNRLYDFGSFRAISLAS